LEYVYIDKILISNLTQATELTNKSVRCSYRYNKNRRRVFLFFHEEVFHRFYSQRIS